jgi:hypothetical protein
MCGGGYVLGSLCVEEFMCGGGYVWGRLCVGEVMCGRGYVWGRLCEKNIEACKYRKKPQGRQFADKFIITEIEVP